MWIRSGEQAATIVMLSFLQTLRLNLFCYLDLRMWRGTPHGHRAFTVGSICGGCNQE